MINECGPSVPHKMTSNASNPTKDRVMRRYRTESDRLRDWDYATPGAYFVTICTKHNQPFFGEVVDDAVRLSVIGQIVEQEWKRTAALRLNVSIDEFIIMPNHLHGIIVIHETHPTPTQSVETPRRGVSTTNRRWKSGTLGAIINQFKSKCTKRIRAAGYPQFAWQRGYYDHIIRNPRDLDRIRRYIRSNPAQWSLDETHVEA